MPDRRELRGVRNQRKKERDTEAGDEGIDLEYFSAFAGSRGGRSRCLSVHVLPFLDEAGFRRR